MTKPKIHADTELLNFMIEDSGRVSKGQYDDTWYYFGNGARYRMPLIQGTTARDAIRQAKNNAIKR